MASAAEVTLRIDEARARAICGKIRDNMTKARDLLVELYEGRGWEAMGYQSWRECAAAEFGGHQRRLYEQLEVAIVARELESEPRFAEFRKEDVSENVRIPDPSDMPDSQLRALKEAPEGERAEVLKVATEAAAGKPTEKVIKAAVEAKWAAPDATPAELVRTVVNGVAKADAAVERLRVAGRIPANVVVEVEDPGDEATTVDDVAVDHVQAAAKVADLSDDEWLALLPASSELTGVSLNRFRMDALAYRRLEPSRRAVKQAYGSVVSELFGRTPWRGFIDASISWWLRAQHPEKWRKCSTPDKGGCDGAGTVPILGGDCSVCKGRGYIAR